MSRRTGRVGQEVRRAVADVVLFGGLRDPRLQPTSAISITGVEVSPDLSIAKVFVDVSNHTLGVDEVIDLLNAGAKEVRREVGRRLYLRRTPEIRFSRDKSIERGAAVEKILHEIRSDEGTGSSENGLEAENTES